MKKKVLSTVLAIALILSSIPITSLASAENTQATDSSKDSSELSKQSENLGTAEATEIDDSLETTETSDDSETIKTSEAGDGSGAEETPETSDDSEITETSKTEEDSGTTEAPEKIKLQLPEGYQNKLTVSDKAYDGTNVATVISEIKLKGVKDDDDISLNIEASFESANVKYNISNQIIEQNVTITISLADTYKEDYVLCLPNGDALESNQITITKKAKINPRKLTVTPQSTSKYYGQNDPEIQYSFKDGEGKYDNIETTSFYENLKEVKMTFSRVEGENVGKYEITAIKSTENGKNYNISLNKSQKSFLEIKPYNPTAVVVPEEGEKYYNDKIILKAPEGFLVSASANEKSFGEEITVDVATTSTYYLRNNDKNNIEEYGAISEAKTYTYSNLLQVPQITGATVKKVNENKSLLFQNYGIFSNDTKLEITITVKGSSQEDTNIEVVLVSPYGYEVTSDDEPVFSESTNTYTSTFVLYVPKGEEDILTCNLQGYINYGDGKQTTAESINILNETNKYDTITFDYGVPKMEIISPLPVGRVIDGSVWYNSKDKENLKMTVKVSDVSGISKICVEDNGVIIWTKEYSAEKVIEKTEEIFLEKISDQSEHNLTVKVYDNAGNVNSQKYAAFYTDFSIGEADVAESTLKIDEIDAYARDKEIVINLPSDSDIEKIEIVCDSKVIENPLESDKKICLKVLDYFATGEHNIKVSLYDKVGNRSQKLYKFYADIDFPVADFEPSGGTVYNNSIWYNLEDNKSQKIDFVFSDAGSGLKKVVIKDNGDVIYNEVSSEWCAKLSDYFKETGKHNIEVTVTDNVGNERAYSKTFYVDYDKPNAKCTFNNEEIQNEAWYGINDKEKNIKITFSEADKNNSGISKVEVIDNGVSIYNNTFNEQIFSYEKTFKIGDYFKSEGKHELVVKVTDNSGNEFEKTYKFNVDYTSPKGETEVQTPDKKIIDGKAWFDSTKDIELKVTINETNIQKVNLYIALANEKGEYTKTIKTFDEGDIQTDSDNKKYVIISTEGLDPKYNHEYKIGGEIFDKANNKYNLVELQLYKDYENPQVNKFIVEKETDAIDKALNVLSFGTYSNDSLLFTAYVSDAEYDSGIDRVEIIMKDIDGTEAIAEMIAGEKDKNGNILYTYKIPLTDNVFEKTLSVIVHDKLEKESAPCVSIKDAKNEEAVSNNYVMIENQQPDVDINLPESDSVKIDNSKVWYKENKEITVTVGDEHSGLREMTVKVIGNGKEILLSEDKDGNKFPKAEDTAKETKKDITNHTFILNTDDIMSKLGSEYKNNSGQYKIEVTVIDNSGNKRTVSKEFYVDKIEPTVKSIRFSIPSEDNITDVSEFIEILEYGYYFKRELVANVEVFDKVLSSGLQKIGYSLVDYSTGKPVPAPVVETNIIDGMAAIPIPKDFKGQIVVKAYDNVNNVSDDYTPQAFAIDTPEKHKSETHIYISDPGKTDYTDSSGNPLYVNDVKMSIKVVDTVSGIREIAYMITAENGSVAQRKITFSNTSYSVGQSLGDGWIITKMDYNLVTEVSREVTFSNDDNDISISVDVTDRANNKSSLTSKTFTVDKTKPIINVEFKSANGNNQYYKEKRIANITVTERNFDSQRIIADIKNAIGGEPSVVFSSNSKTEHVAIVTFDEGDYKFNISGTDRGGHGAEVHLSGGNESSFYVDLSDPKETDNFASLEAEDSQNIFASEKGITITINEHNFDSSLVNVKVYKAGAGKMNNMNVEKSDCTEEILKGIQWKSNGDSHELSFNLSSDAVYQIEIEGKDLSGRSFQKKYSPVFEIDKTKPILDESSLKNDAVTVYDKQSEKESADEIIFFDSNIAKIEYHFTSYQISKDENGKYCKMSTKTYTDSVDGNKWSLSDEFFKQDGIYTVKAIAYDTAGNKSDDVTHTYVILRETKFLVYIPQTDKEAGTGLYAFDGKGKSASEFDDIEISLYILNNQNFEVQMDGKTISSDYIQYFETDENKTINQIKHYHFAVKKSYIIDNYSEDAIDTEYTLNVVVSDEEASETVTLGYICIDNIKPIGEYESELLNWQWYSGYYDMTSKEITVTGVSPDIDIERCKIIDEINGEEREIKIDKYENNTIMFTLGEGTHNIMVTLVDKAGNEYPMPALKNIYIGGFWSRWWSAFAILAVVLIAATVTVVVVVRKKKKKEKTM